jgi:hypothetical protein
LIDVALSALAVVAALLLAWLCINEYLYTRRGK